MNAFIFVVESVIGARVCSSTQKARHFVLIESHFADVGIKIFVVIVKLTAFAIRFLCFFYVAHNLLYAPSLFLIRHIAQTVDGVLQDYLRGESIDNSLSLFAASVRFV